MKLTRREALQAGLLGIQTAVDIASPTPLEEIPPPAPPPLMELPENILKDGLNTRLREVHKAITELTQEHERYLNSSVHQATCQDAVDTVFRRHYKPFSQVKVLETATNELERKLKDVWAALDLYNEYTKFGAKALTWREMFSQATYTSGKQIAALVRASADEKKMDEAAHQNGLAIEMLTQRNGVPHAKTAEHAVNLDALRDAIQPLKEIADKAAGIHLYIDQYGHDIRLSLVTAQSFFEDTIRDLWYEHARESEQAAINTIKAQGASKLRQKINSFIAHKVRESSPNEFERKAAEAYIQSLKNNPASSIILGAAGLLAAAALTIETPETPIANDSPTESAKLEHTPIAPIFEPSSFTSRVPDPVERSSSAPKTPKNIINGEAPEAGAALAGR